MIEEEPSWWQVGGQVRLMQMVRDSASVQKARFFPMQTELEGAVNQEKWALVASLGVWRPLEAPTEEKRVYSRNHYGLVRFNDNWFLRIGQFRVNHGLGLPDHTLYSQQLLGWSHSHETKNTEISYFNENYLIQGTWITPSKLLVSEEVVYGHSLHSAILFDSNHKLGFNHTQMTRGGINEVQWNLHSVVELTKFSFLQAEVARREIQNSSRSNTNTYFIRYSYDLPRGFRPFLQLELAETQDKKVTSILQSQAVGSEWFPITHVDVMTYVAREVRPGYEDNLLFNFIGHVYF
jgi:hypothetical protein